MTPKKNVYENEVVYEKKVYENNVYESNVYEDEEIGRDPSDLEEPSEPDELDDHKY